MIRLAKPTAFLLCAALGLAVAGPALAQQSPAADQTAPAKKKTDLRRLSEWLKLRNQVNQKKTSDGGEDEE